MFHLHATEIDSSHYAGPSGYRSFGVDFGVSEEANGAGVVFTSLGHPKLSDGSPDETRMLMNADYYFVDERDPDGKKQVTYDMGIIEVPVKE